MRRISFRPSRTRTREGNGTRCAHLEQKLFWISFDRDLDEMLSSLGVAPVSEVLSSLSSVNSIASDTSVNATPDGSLQPASLNGTR